MGWCYNVYPYDGVLWYVNVLFLVTVIWYIICRLKKINDDLYKCLCILMVILGICCMHYRIDLPFLFFQNGQGYVSFFIGVLLNDIYKTKGYNKALVVISLSATIVFMLLGRLYGYKQVFGGVLMMFYVFVSPVIFVSAITLYPIRILLESRILRLTSKISFSIYIIHERIYYLVFDLDKKYGLGIDYSNILVWISMMLSVIAVSIVWYMCIEKSCPDVCSRNLEYMMYECDVRILCRNKEQLYWLKLLSAAGR